MQEGGRSTKRGRESVTSTDLTELLKRFEALSLVVREEIPHVLNAGIRVPETFGQCGDKGSKIRKTRKTRDCRSAADNIYV